MKLTLTEGKTKWVGVWDEEDIELYGQINELICAKCHSLINQMPIYECEEDKMVYCRDCQLKKWPRNEFLCRYEKTINNHIHTCIKEIIEKDGETRI